MDLKVDVRGLAGLQEKLQQLEPRLRRKVAFSALSSGAKVIRQQAQLNANSLFQRDTGELAKGVRQRARSTKGVPGVRITFSKRAWYGRLLGTGWKHARGGQQIPGRPFMHPAFMEKRVEAVQRIVQVLREKLASALRP